MDHISIWKHWRYGDTTIAFVVKSFRRFKIRQGYIAAMARSAWIIDFVEQVLAGDFALTQQLVVAVQNEERGHLDLPKLCRELDDLDEQRYFWQSEGKGHPELPILSGGLEDFDSQKNLLLRGWLERHKAAVLERWVKLGFPSPPISANRVVIFDFDQVLSIVEVKTLVLQDQENLVFGGATRVAELDVMFEQLTAAGVALAIVSRNSGAVVRSALHMSAPGTNLWRHFEPWGLVLGEEDHGNVPKNETIERRVLTQLGLRADAALFVDDQRFNVIAVESGCPGIAVLHVEGGGGLGSSGMARVRGWALEGKSIEAQ